jgi:hypothetical protein
MWWAHQCESNTSSTWYDIELKKYQRIKARGRRRRRRRRRKRESDA